MTFKSLTPTLIGLLVLFSSCKHFQDPEFRRLENFRVKKIGLKESLVGFNVTYFNPNHFGVKAKEGVAEIYIDSAYIGRFNQDSLVTVKGSSEFSIPLTGTISLETAMRLNVQNLAQNDIAVQAKGSIRVGKAGFYVTKPIVYSGKLRLDQIKF